MEILFNKVEISFNVEWSFADDITSSTFYLVPDALVVYLIYSDIMLCNILGKLIH